MLRQHTGRPGTPTIHPDWAAGHQHIPDGAASATGAIRKPGTTQDWDPATEQMVSVPYPPHHTDPVRVQALTTQTKAVVAAEDPEAIAQYLVVAPAGWSAAVDDLVTITDSGDPLLDGQTLRVIQLVLGDHRFERDLFCVLNT